MKRFFDFWNWAIEQHGSPLLSVVAMVIPVFALLAWVFGAVYLFTIGHPLLGGLLFVLPTALVLMRGVSEYNRCHPKEDDQ
tara:strand:+ start:18 stop:260 length:243 start_codon:yes stop_codon:yes gene_type:complete